MERFRERRARAGVLLSYVGEARDEREALRVYREWQRGRLTYREALAKLKKGLAAPGEGGQCDED